MNRSKLAREMPRFAASGHIRSMQFLKSATAARMASGCISGCPEAPGWPLQASLCGVGTEPVAIAERLRVAIVLRAGRSGERHERNKHRARPQNEPLIRIVSRAKVAAI